MSWRKLQPYIRRWFFEQLSLFFFNLTAGLLLDRICGRSKPLPYRYLKHRLFPIYQKHSFHFAARRNITPKAHHFPLAENITRRRRISLFNRPLRLHPMPPSGPEGDREAVEGAGGYESSGLPCMRCLPLFSLVEAKVSSLLCAFSFSRVATAPSRREPFR